MENHHAINGKIHYFDWAIFNSHVKLPEGMSFLHIKLQEIASNGTHKVFWVLGSSLLILPLESHKFFASAL